MIRLLSGDARDVLPTLAAESVQCVVTSPPYYGLRDYGTALWDGGDAACDHTGIRRNHGDEKQATSAGTSRDPVSRSCLRCGAVRVDRQIGLEATPDFYLQTMVGVFREVRRVLRRDGTCWVNMGDSYSSGTRTTQCDPSEAILGKVTARPSAEDGGARRAPAGIGKPKDLLLMPARLALALQADGWWIRSDIIWHKPNPMPESCTDRPTSAHEHVFLLTRSARYYYDADAVREELTGNTNWAQSGETPIERAGYHGAGRRASMSNPVTARNLRNVWTIATHAYPDAHFATFPPELAERCIKAGTRPGDTVLDPFAGAGTTLLVADRLQRDAVGVEFDTTYTEMAMERCRADAPLFTSFPPAEPPEDMRMADLFTDMAAD